MNTQFACKQTKKDYFDDINDMMICLYRYLGEITIFFTAGSVVEEFSHAILDKDNNLLLCENNETNC